MKQYQHFLSKSVAYKPFLMLCLTGMGSQSCSSESEVIPENLVQEISLCRSLKEGLTKDSINARFDSSSTDIAGVYVHSDSLKYVLAANKNLTNLLNKKAGDEGRWLADTVFVAAYPAIGVSQPESGANDSPPVTNPAPVVVQVPEKPIVVVPSPPKTESPLINEITVKTSQGVLLHPPQNPVIGLSKAYPLAVDTYMGLLSQMPGGENEFWFYGKLNQNNYPTGEWVAQGNGYSTIDLPTHAVNARAGSDRQHPEYDQLICKIEYTIKDSKGNIVMFCKDTKGGFHPGFVQNERGNNHPKESQRFLPYGTYTVEFKNLTQGSVNAPIRVTYNRAGGNATMGEYFDAVVNNQQTITFTIEIFEQKDEISMFKLNCNMVP